MEPTTIASVARLIAETLETHYQVAPANLLRRAGIDPELLERPEARVSRANILRLWQEATAATKDPCIGLAVGFNIRTTTYHALGYAWLASHKLLDALQRLRRYYQVIATVPLSIEIRPMSESYMLEVVYPDPAYPAPPIALDSFLASIVKLCRSASSEAFSPLEVWVNHDHHGQEEVVEQHGPADQESGMGVD